MKWLFKQFILMFCVLFLLGSESLFSQNNPGNFPLFEGFEGTGRPFGWNGWVNGYNYDGNITSYPDPRDNLPENYAMRYAGGPYTPSQNICLITPLINLQTIGSNNTAILYFDIRMEETGQWWNSWFRVLIPSDIWSANGIILMELDLAHFEEWTTVEVDLSEFIGEEIHLAFLDHHDSNTQGYLYKVFLDNISIKIVPQNLYIINTYPYYESFEQQQGPSEGWLFINQISDTSWGHYAFTSDDPQYRYIARTGNYSAGSETPSNVLVSPKLQIHAEMEADIYLNYYAMCYSELPSEIQYSVMVSTTEADIGCFNEIYNETLANDTVGWNKRTFNLSEYQGQCIYFAFQPTEGTGFLLIDDFYVGSIPQVFQPPTNLFFRNSNNGITLLWCEPELGSTATLSGYIITRNEVEIADNITGLEYTDSDIQSGAIYEYSVYAVYMNPFGVSEPISIIVQASSDSDIALYLQHNKLVSNYPNPFNPETTIMFKVVSTGNVKIDIYNIKGQKIKTITDNIYNAGSYKVLWNGHDDSGHNVANGIYFYKMQTNGLVETHKMVYHKH